MKSKNLTVLIMSMALINVNAMASANGGSQQLDSTPDYYGSEQTTLCLEGYKCPDSSNTSNTEIKKIKFLLDGELSFTHIKNTKAKFEMALKNINRNGFNLNFVSNLTVTLTKYELYGHNIYIESNQRATVNINATVEQIEKLLFKFSN
jgi:hypothetical protein